MPSYCTLQGARRQLGSSSNADDSELFFYALTAAA